MIRGTFNAICGGRIIPVGASLEAQIVKNLPAMWETQVRSLSQEDPLGEGHGNPLQYYCLENSMDRGPWQGLQRVGHN